MNFWRGEFFYCSTNNLITLSINIRPTLYFTDAAITITNGTFAWDTEDEGPAISEYVNLLIYVIVY